ncbi:S1 RNA-binding domain-containing protein [Streptococcus pneumoniae]|nr:S1 RNA-binding domain-containing protein [Streptococcus pneumoniae]
MCFTHSFFHFAILRKSLQTTSASPCRIWLLTSSVSSATSKQCFELTSSVSSTTSKQCFELTSSVLSTTSKQCFEQPAASFLVCSLIFIEY